MMNRLGALGRVAVMLMVLALTSNSVKTTTEQMELMNTFTLPIMAMKLS